jgi:hypothetical protein
LILETVPQTTLKNRIDITTYLERKANLHLRHATINHNIAYDDECPHPAPQGTEEDN